MNDCSTKKNYSFSFVFKVNYASMLEKCLVGRFVSMPNPAEQSKLKGKNLPARLRFDYRQLDDKTLTLFIYTTCATLTKENIFVHIENSKTITVVVFIDEFVHTIAIGKPKTRSFTTKKKTKFENFI